MQVSLVVEDGAAHRNADGAAEVAHHVEETARIFEPLGRQTAETEVHRRRHSEYLWQAAQHLWDPQLVRTPIMGDEAERPHGCSETREAEDHQPAGVDLAGERHINRHPGKRSSPRRKDRDAGLPGAAVPARSSTDHTAKRALATADTSSLSGKTPNM